MVKVGEGGSTGVPPRTLDLTPSPAKKLKTNKFA